MKKEVHDTNKNEQILVREFTLVDALVELWLRSKRAIQLKAIPNFQCLLATRSSPLA